jgi:hypothetical protein
VGFKRSEFCQFSQALGGCGGPPRGFVGVIRGLNQIAGLARYGAVLLIQTSAADGRFHRLSLSVR